MPIWTNEFTLMVWFILNGFAPGKRVWAANFDHQPTEGPQDWFLVKNLGLCGCSENTIPAVQCENLVWVHKPVWSLGAAVLSQGIWHLHRFIYRFCWADPADELGFSESLSQKIRWKMTGHQQHWSLASTWTCTNIHTNL